MDDDEMTDAEIAVEADAMMDGSAWRADGFYIPPGERRPTAVKDEGDHAHVLVQGGGLPDEVVTLPQEGRRKRPGPHDGETEAQTRFRLLYELESARRNVEKFKAFLDAAEARALAGGVSRAEVAKVLGITRQAVQKREAARRSTSTVTLTYPAESES